MAEKPAPTVAEAQATRLAFLEKQLLELPQSAKWWKRNDWASLYKAAEDAADSYVDQLLKDFNPEESVGSEGKTKASCAEINFRSRAALQTKSLEFASRYWPSARRDSRYASALERNSERWEWYSRSLRCWLEFFTRS
jgi:hypothetical protein